MAQGIVTTNGHKFTPMFSTIALVDRADLILIRKPGEVRFGEGAETSTRGRARSPELHESGVDDQSWNNSEPSLSL